MARIRSIKPEFWADRKLARLSRDARLLYVALWNQADEHGRVQGDVRYVKGHCLPYDDDLSLKDVERLLAELVEAGRVVRYVVDEDPYLHLPTLGKHQRLEPNKAASRLPAPPETAQEPPPAPAPAPTDSDRPARRASPSESRADLLGEAEPIVVQQVAGSREHVAGSMLCAVPDKPGRADVEQVCSAMSEALTANDVKHKIGDEWRRQARLMLDSDHRPLAEVLSVIAWCAQDTFERANVHSVPKLRERYDALRLKSQNRKQVGSGRLPWTEADYENQSWGDPA